MWSIHRVTTYDPRQRRWRHTGLASHSRTARLAWILAALLPSVVSTSCARAIDPWEQNVKAAARSAQTRFGHDVLTDGVVTRQEYREAAGMVVACGKRHGVSFSEEDRYGLTIFSSAGRDRSDVLGVCESSDVAVIRSLYEDRYKD